MRNMKQNLADLADSLERDEQHNESIKRAQQELKTHLKRKFECIFEGLSKQDHSTLLNEIYTELYITEGGSGGSIMNTRSDRLRQHPRDKPHRRLQSSAMTSLSLYLDKRHPSELCLQRASLVLGKPSLCRSSFWTGQKEKPIRMLISSSPFLSEI
ncbi:hypothetical protein ANANG_G00212350 [Anguilla anguilla]|uniref:FISNA domain-containing protein n=1 Tax=Anguilla anguilla TaxID=7936 RepID=A0A9D3RRA4_ANGAN|nr:hypothetical protein ANANG_G00212350 [Anguilla anguilla]